MENNNNPLFYLPPFNFDHNSDTNSNSDHHHYLESIDLKMRRDDQIFSMEILDHQHGFFGYDNNGVMANLLNQDQQQEASIFDYFDSNSMVSQSPQMSLPFHEVSTIISTNNNYLNHLPNSRRSIDNQSPFASLSLLNSYRTGFNKFINTAETRGQLGQNLTCHARKISTEEIMRIAGARYIHGNLSVDYFTPVDHSFGYALSGLTDKETKGIELVHLLLAAVEKLGFQQFERAKTLIRNCEDIASSRANPIERIVLFFALGLRDRIENHETRAKNVEKNDDNNDDIVQGLSTNITTIICNQKIPFFQVMQFPAIQAIFETFESKTKLHLIDLEIRSGIQWASLMESLAERSQKPVELFKITALVGRATSVEEKIEETRKRLMSLAESLSLPFLFNVVKVYDIMNIREEMFDIDRENGEIIVVHCPMVLRTMITKPHSLESLMRVIRRLKPSLMTVLEVEADLNSPSFTRRFIEALFFYGAFFDSLDTCLNQPIDEDFRATMEVILGVGIRNIVAMEGTERVNRSVRVRVWRAFFKRFGMVEVEMSESCYYQASLVAKQFGNNNNNNCCTLDRDGNCLVVGWKGTPIHSLSAWKFNI